MASRIYVHLDCMVLYSLYHLNYKHQTKTLPNYIECYVSLMIVPCYEEKKIIMIKIKFYNEDIVG